MIFFGCFGRNYIINVYKVIGLLQKNCKFVEFYSHVWRN